MAAKSGKKTITKKTSKKAAPKRKAAKGVTAPTASGTDTKKAAPAKGPKAEGKLSALDAAAKVLAASAEPLDTKQMIE